jgi:hypothetical protein
VGHMIRAIEEPRAIVVWRCSMSSCAKLLQTKCLTTAKISPIGI